MNCYFSCWIPGKTTMVRIVCWPRLLSRCWSFPQIHEQGKDCRLQWCIVAKQMLKGYLENNSTDNTSSSIFVLLTWRAWVSWTPCAKERSFSMFACFSQSKVSVDDPDSPQKANILQELMDSPHVDRKVFRQLNWSNPNIFVILIAITNNPHVSRLFRSPRIL